MKVCFSRIANKMEWSILSKAFLKSKKQAKQRCFESTVFLICTHDSFDLKPNRESDSNLRSIETIKTRLCIYFQRISKYYPFHVLHDVHSEEQLSLFYRSLERRPEISFCWSSLLLRPSWPVEALLATEFKIEPTSKTLVLRNRNGKVFWGTCF